jgi:uncharacterized protein
MLKNHCANLIKHFKLVLYIVVSVGFTNVHAGSFEDFFKAIAIDDAPAVADLLKRGFDPNTINADGMPALLMAVRVSSFKVATLLLESPKIKAEVRNTADENPLMLAALKGELELCRLLIKKGAYVNKPGWAPLHYAATNGHLAVMQLLLDHHAYIDASSPNGTTPLMMAAHYGTAEAVKLLLDAGADVSIKNQLQLTALDMALRADRKDAAAVITAFIRRSQPKGTW